MGATSAARSRWRRVPADSTSRSPGSRGSGRSSPWRCSTAWAPTGAFEATLGLARDLAERLGIPWGGASLVCAPIGDPDGASAALRDAGIRAASRGSAIRCSAHVYTTRDDIDRAARAIEPFLTR